MASEPTRDPFAGHVLTPQSAALVVIDDQPSQVQTVTSMDREVLVGLVALAARLALLQPDTTKKVKVARDRARGTAVVAPAALLSTPATTEDEP